MSNFRSLQFLSIVFAFLLAGEAFAGFIDFENGTDGQPIASTIPGIEFTATGGQDWIYGDWRTGSYNGPYPDGAYYSNGNFFAWLGTGQGSGTITFTQAHATYFTIGYSAQYMLILEAYDDATNLIDTQTGTANLNTGEMDFLTVQGDNMASVVVREGTGFGNYWVVDDIETDAVVVCTLDEHCDDGVFCNGQERCVDYTCAEAEPPLPCQDDGVWCNGQESCDEGADTCVHEFGPDNPRCPGDDLFCNGEDSCSEASQECINSGNPCLSDQTCDEELDKCIDEETPPEETPPDEELWPKGKVSGGCCGC